MAQDEQAAWPLTAHLIDELGPEEPLHEPGFATACVRSRHCCPYHDREGAVFVAMPAAVPETLPGLLRSDLHVHVAVVRVDVQRGVVMLGGSWFAEYAMETEHHQTDD